MRLRPCSAAQHDVVDWARLSVTLNGNPTFGLRDGLFAGAGGPGATARSGTAVGGLVVEQVLNAC